MLDFADKRLFHTDGRLRHIVIMSFAVIFIFMLGIANFALHRAVFDSGHPIIEQMPRFVHMLGGKIALAAEFLVLLTAMLLAANGWPGLAWGYAAYSALNALAGWLILTGRV